MIPILVANQRLFSWLIGIHGLYWRNCWSWPKLGHGVDLPTRCHHDRPWNPPTVAVDVSVFFRENQHVTHDGSMVLLYMVTWIPSIYPLYVSINLPAPWILWVIENFQLWSWLPERMALWQIFELDIAGPKSPKLDGTRLIACHIVTMWRWFP